MWGNAMSAEVRKNGERRDEKKHIIINGIVS